MSKQTIIFSLYCILVISIVAIAIYIHLKKKKANSIFINRIQILKMNKLISMYLFLSKVPIIKGFLNRISRRYEILCPSDKKEIYKKSMVLALSSWSISGLIIIFIFIRKPSFFNAALSIFLVWVVNSKLVRFIIKWIEMKLLKQLNDFISDIRHFYYINGSVEDAFLEAIDLAGKEMKIHANKIYEILTSENIEEEVIKYNSSIQNNFLKMLLAQCVTVVTYGDKEVNNSSLFLTNLINLKTDINIEIRKMKQIQFLFMGISMMVITPVFFLDIVRKWAVSTFSDLYKFYYGSNGIVLMVLIFVFTIILYDIVGYLEENRPIIKKNYDYLEKISNIKPIKLAIDNYMKKHYGKMKQLRADLKKMGESITPKQLMIKRMIFAAAVFVFGVILFTYLHNLNGHNLIYRVDNVEQLTNAASKNDQNKMKAIITANILKLENKENETEKDIKKELSGVFQSELITNSVANEIYNRINAYKNEYLKWYEVVFIIFLSYLAYWMPYWMILIRKSIMKLNMNNEVIQFQSIILMLMYIDRMTVPKILEFMESFAVIFKDSIRTCLNEYDAGDIEALNKLRDAEDYRPFQRLVDNCLISDKIGIEKACDEVAVERANFIDERKQDEEMNITNKGILSKFCGYVFFLFVIAIYLIIPFMVSIMKQFHAFSNGINN